MNADTAEGFEPIAELHCSEAPVRSLTILRGQPGGATADSSGGRQIQVNRGTICSAQITEIAVFQPHSRQIPNTNGCDLTW